MFHPNCTVLLYRRLNSTDGKAVFGFPETLRGCLIAHRELAPDTGTLRESSLLHLQCQAAPSPGDEVMIDSRRFTIGEVRNCCDLQGHIRGFRCTFLKE